jgi:hypothetical protein
MFVSLSLIVHIKGCGILLFDSMYSSDHIPPYVDFDLATLFRHPAIGTEKAALQDPQLDNPRLIDASEAALCKQFDNHNVNHRVRNLYATDSGKWKNNNEFQFDKIDCDITRAMECAVNKC